MQRSISEILAEADSKGKKDAKIQVLRDNYTPALGNILVYAYSPDIKWLLPEGDPPYSSTRYIDQEGNLFSEIRRLYLFVEGGNPGLKQNRREALFVAMLETVDASDAKLLCAMKDRKLPYKSLTSKLILEAFPGLYPDHPTAKG